MTKYCNTCKKEKDITEFYIAKASKDGYSSQCKDCIKARQAKYNAIHREELREKDKEYRKANIDKIKERENSPERKAYLKKYREEHKNPEYHKQRYEEKKEEILQKQKIYYYYGGGKEKRETHYRNNKDKIKAYQQKYRQENADKIREKDKERYYKNKIARNISNMIWHFCNGLKCERHWEDLVPYDYYALRQHLESQFTPEMSWNNYGRNGWVIDHIIPQAVFTPIDSVDSIEFRICWSLYNLRPLMNKDNLSRPRDEGSDISEDLKIDIISKALSITTTEAKTVWGDLLYKYYKKVNYSE